MHSQFKKLPENAAVNKDPVNVLMGGGQAGRDRAFRGFMPRWVSQLHPQLQLKFWRWKSNRHSSHCYWLL